MSIETPASAPAASPAAERKLTLHDFLRTAIKINASDIHLQAGSIPMLRVDGRPKFLDCPALSDDTMKAIVKQIIDRQQEPTEKQHLLDHKGAVDLAYQFENVARFRTNIFHSRERYAIVMQDRDEDPQLRRPEPAATDRKVRRVPPRYRDRVGHDRFGQVHHACGDHRQHQQEPGRADHHRRRPDRVPARKRDVAHQPGGGRAPTARASSTPFAP